MRKEMRSHWLPANAKPAKKVCEGPIRSWRHSCGRFGPSGAVHSSISLNPIFSMRDRPAFTGAPEQLWRIEQLPDGGWRIMSKSKPVAISDVGGSFATVAKFDAERRTTLADRDPMRFHRHLIVLLGAAAAVTQVAPVMLTPPASPDKAPDANGFFQRWLLLEPIESDRLTDTAVQATVKKEYFPDQLTVVQKDGRKVTTGGTQLTCHAVGTKRYPRGSAHDRIRARQSNPAERARLPCEDSRVTRCSTKRQRVSP
jgi:hypothetical protein